MSANNHKSSGNLIKISTNKNTRNSPSIIPQQKVAPVSSQQHSLMQNNSNSNSNSNNNNTINNSTQQQEAQPQQPAQNITSSTFTFNHNNQQQGNNSTNTTHIPPRYQPPPQPATLLKHFSSSTGKSLYQPELSIPHLNIKYPPEIPKLSTIYIPDGIQKNSRFSQKYRLSGGVNAGNHQLFSSNQDEHLIFRQQQQDMLKFVRKTDGDPQALTNGQLNQATARLTAEQNRHLQSLLNELRVLKEANQHLSDDNQELRDLCCFLDDDRQKGRKLAREWQRFGRYTASVMRQEVSAYQSKLRQLDDKQQELIRDNLELKELCLYLDEERAHVATNTLCVNCGGSTRPGLRDDGDGSSSSTNADDVHMTTIRNFEHQIPDINIRSSLGDQTLQYVRCLERRIRQLEEERTVVNGNTTNSNNNNISAEQAIPDPISGRPEAVVRALQVLEVREQLERDRICNNSNMNGTTNLDHLDDGEKALVREMCNVVWRKLEENPSGP